MFNRFPGRQNTDVEIAEEAWAFFRDKRRHPTALPAGAQRQSSDAVC
jgi:hypothetical protein